MICSSQVLLEISSFLGIQCLTNPANRHSLFQWPVCKMLNGWREFTLAPETAGSAGDEEEHSLLCSCPWEPKGGVTLSNDFSRCSKLEAALDSLPWPLWWLFCKLFSEPLFSCLFSNLVEFLTLCLCKDKEDGSCFLFLAVLLSAVKACWYGWSPHLIFPQFNLHLLCPEKNHATFLK